MDRTAAASGAYTCFRSDLVKLLYFAWAISETVIIIIIIIIIIIVIIIIIIIIDLLLERYCTNKVFLGN